MQDTIDDVNLISYFHNLKVSFGGIDLIVLHLVGRSQKQRRPHDQVPVHPRSSMTGITLNPAKSCPSLPWPKSGP